MIITGKGRGYCVNYIGAPIKDLKTFGICTLAPSQRLSLLFLEHLRSYVGFPVVTLGTWQERSRNTKSPILRSGVSEITLCFS